MQILSRLLHRRHVNVPVLPPPRVPGHDRNDIAFLRSYDQELQKMFKQRMRALDLDAEVLGRQSPGDR
jgi:hypothetical protein